MSVSYRGHHHVLFFFQKSLRGLFWSSFFRQNGLSLVDVFTFVYLYSYGQANLFFGNQSFSSFQKGMLCVVGYVVLLRIAALLSVFPMAKWASTVGLPKAAIIGNTLMALRYGLLAFSTVHPFFIFAAAIVQGMEIAVFTPAYDTMFARLASSGSVGRDVGAFTFILRLSHALLPALSGTLIMWFGFQAAFIGAVILLLVSNVPLLSIDWKAKLTYPKPSLLFSWYRANSDARILFALLGRYVSDAVSELWPIYLIVLFEQVDRIGFLTSLALFISLLVTYFSGWYVDHAKKNFSFVLGGILLSLFWVGRINVMTIQVILILEIAQRIVESFFNPSFDAFTYRISKKLDTFAFHVYKEVCISFVSIVFWTTLGIAFLCFGPIWNALFIVAAIGMLCATLLYI